MNKVALIGCCLIMSLGFSALAEAQTKKPCMKIAAACEAAGYRLGDTLPGKNIWKDCVKPLLAGQTIGGVTADPADIQACRTKREAKQQQKNAAQPVTPATPAPQPVTPTQ